ncbi:SIMPL domain-containing protein [Porphyromonadaceae bacterium W3.11]|nr:SIMPL domain-containing protein [Porphyromonadaceae bacterium W3.11]
MNQDKRKLIGLILIIATILIAIGLGSYTVLHRNDHPKTISVKGSAEQEIVSDLIVWNITILTNSPTPLQGLREVERQRETVKRFLSRQEIPNESIEVGPVEYNERTNGYYDNQQQRYIEVHQGYDVQQTLTISSHDVDKVELVSRNVGDLIELDVTARSNSPRYYYTKLADLKLEMLAKAAEDARNRAKKIAKESNSSLGGLRKSNMGVFQILGKNSEEDYSWGGTFNTSSKVKVINITVSSDFLVH